MPISTGTTFVPVAIMAILSFELSGCRQKPDVSNYPFVRIVVRIKNQSSQGLFGRTFRCGDLAAIASRTASTPQPGFGADKVFPPHQTEQNLQSRLTPCLHLPIADQP
jgi:hypothetical protein